MTDVADAPPSSGGEQGDPRPSGEERGTQLDLRKTGDRIEELFEQLRTTADPRALDQAEELLRLVAELYGAGLARVVQLVQDEAPELLRIMVDDELLGSLLVVHDLHPDDLAARVAAALDSVRPFLHGHGGDVLLLDLDESRAAVHLRLLGSCDGCPSSAVTLKMAVEQAIAEAAPEIVIIDVEQPTTEVAAGIITPVELGRRSPVDGVMTTSEAAVDDPLGVLARIRQSQPRERPRPGERCEMCATPIPDDHDHVVDLEQRSLQCTCRGCYLLFAPEGAGGSRYRAVPDRFLSFPDFALSPGQWDGLQIPVSVAFFFLNSTLERVAAFYPGPAGATESLLSLDTWDEVVAANPGLATLAARCRGVPRPLRPRRRCGRVLPRADRRLLRAGRPAPSALARLRRRARGPRGAGGVLRRRPGPGTTRGRTVR